MRTTEMNRTRTVLLLLSLTQLLFAADSVQAQTAAANPVEAQARKKHCSCSWLRFRVTRITNPAGEPAWGVDLNDRGDVVGYVPGELGANRAFLWSNGKAVDLHDRISPTALSTLPTAINNKGEIIGLYTPDQLQPSVAFLLDKRSVTYLDDAHFVWPQTINNRGQIVGYSQFPGERESAVLWDKGQITRLPLPAPATWGYATDINDRGEILGSGYWQVGWQHYFQGLTWKPPYTEATPVAIPEPGLYPGGIDERGNILLIVDNLQSAILKGDKLVRLEPLPEDAVSEAFDMNDWGLVAGMSETPGLPTERTAVIWLNGSKPCRLFDLIPPRYRPAELTRLSLAEHVNNRGQVLAGGYLLTPTLLR